jgi:hypothetical protein
MALFQNPLRKREEAPEPAPAEPARDPSIERQERLDQQIRFLREQERRRASSSVPPPGVERLTTG